MRDLWVFVCKVCVPPSVVVYVASLTIKALFTWTHIKLLWIAISYGGLLESQGLNAS